MASFTGTNGTRLSAPTLTDPKALKKHMENGTPVSSHFQFSPLPARCSSEPLCSESASEIPFLPDIALQRSKDDAYPILENKGKKTMSLQSATTAGQAASSTFDPRRLLDPKGFSNNQNQRNSQGASTESGSGQEIPSSDQLNSKTTKNGKSPSEIKVDCFNKRDRKDYEGQGMGSLIESLHNVTQREGRPQKKSKVEKDQLDVEDDNKVDFVGGGKGGEFGDYLKEKKKEGIAESGSANAVVDLTGGMYNLPKYSFPFLDTEWYLRR